MTPPQKLEPAAAGAAGGIVLEGPEVAVKARGYWEQVWIRFRRDRVAVASGVFIIVLFLAAFVGAPVAAAILGHGPDQPFNSTFDPSTGQTITNSGLDPVSELPVGPWTWVAN